jgi:hypothetical protein
MSNKYCVAGYTHKTKESLMEKKRYASVDGTYAGISGMV